MNRISKSAWASFKHGFNSVYLSIMIFPIVVGVMCLFGDNGFEIVFGTIVILAIAQLCSRIWKDLKS